MWYLFGNRKVKGIQWNNEITTMQFGILECWSLGNESIDCIFLLYQVWYLFGNRKVKWTQRNYGIIPLLNLENLESWNLRPQNLEMVSWNGINWFHFFTLCGIIFLKLECQRSTKTLQNQLIVILESRNLGILEYGSLEMELFNSIYLYHMWYFLEQERQ